MIYDSAETLAYYLPNNIQVINGSLRLSADQRVDNNKTITTGSEVSIAGGSDWGIIEMCARFPNGQCLKSWVWFSRVFRDSDLNEYEGQEYIDFVSFEKFNPHLIRSGLNFGKHNKFSGFMLSMTYDFTNVFNVFTMEWTKDFIYWKLNGKEYHNEFINKYFEFENGINYNKIRAPFDGKYKITFTISCVPINDRRVDKNSSTNPYLLIDYIKMNSSESDNDSENGSELNDSAVIKYGITGFLVLFFMSVSFCFVLYFIKKRTSITKSINRANNNDSKTTKRDDFRESFDLYDNNEQNYYYEIVDSQVVEYSQNLNNTYLEII
jgi:hypothetical protein